MAQKWLLWMFLNWNLKTILPYLKPDTSNLSICKIWRKTKVPKFGTRNAWKHTNVLKLEFEKVFLYLKWKPWNLSSWKISQTKKKKLLKFGIKNVLFGYFLAGIWKILLPYLKSASSSLSISEIGSKTPDFGIFGWNLKQCCHIWNQHLQICLFAKFYQKTVMPKFWPEMPDLRVFGLKFENNNTIFEIRTLKVVYV